MQEALQRRKSGAEKALITTGLSGKLGILPIKKIKDESALNNFDEYTMLKSKPITKYFGFTEEEVKMLCEKYAMDFDSYWKNTSSFESINPFQNDLSTVASKDDALTALIHLGYLGYDADRKSAYMPNYEVALAFEKVLQILCSFQEQMQEINLQW